MKKEVIKSFEDFSTALFDLYKRYSTNLLTYIVAMIEAYLSLSDISISVAATIKLFNMPLTSKIDRNEITVYTAFRDKKTYDKHEREIGTESYTIDGNVDFIYCLQKDHYFINNAIKDSANYLNEHVDFDKYYNCTVVVPIRIKELDSSYKFLGYLCCDCLNHDNNNEIFGKETAQLLFSMAQLYGTFLETLDSNWIDRTAEIENLPNTFLSVIYNKTFIGKTK